MEYAKMNPYTLNNKILKWTEVFTKTCDICDASSHVRKDCIKNRNGNGNKRFQHLYEKYQPTQYENYKKPKPRLQPKQKQPPLRT